MNPGRINEFYRNAIVLLLFIAGVHLLYGKTVQAGFVTDFTGLQERLDGAPFSDFLNCFGFPAMHQVTNFFLYLFYKWFGTNGLPWYFVFTSLHIANGFLAFLLGKKIFWQSPPCPPRGGVSQPSPTPLEGGRGVVALMASLLFLFSPFQADAVVWKVCFNFLFCSFLMLSSLWQLIRYFETGKKVRLLWSHVLFTLALFTFELAVAFPLIAVLIVIWWKYGKTNLNRPNSGGATEAIIQKDIENGSAFEVRGIFLPQVLLLALYFLLNKLILGGWVGHYGESVHLNFDLKIIGSTMLKYFTKYLLFWREWPHGYREDWMAFCEKPAVAYGALTGGILLLAAGIFFFKKLPVRLRLTGFFWLLFFIALLPVNNLYVAWILQGENDRYGYFASVFFFMGHSALLLFLPKIIRYGVFAVLFLVSIFFLYRMTVYWENSTRIYYSLLDDFRWEDAPEVYVLAFPENYYGVQMFKDFSRKDLALKHALKYSAGKETEGKFYQIAQFNMTSPDDGVSVQTDSINHFTVTFNQWGNWWWRNGIGTWNYETDKYLFTVEGNGSKIELKQPAEGAVFIYSVDGAWRETRPN